MFNKVGLALGGGGAKGIAHIPVLETIDEHQLPIGHITGTSVGAIVAVLYASGKTGKEIRALFISLFETDGYFWKDLFDVDNIKAVKWYDLLSPNFSASSGMVNLDRFLDFIIEQVGVDNLEALKIPITIVAADFWQRKQVVFNQGDIKTAIRASVALAGVFSPVIIGEQVLVDGGAVNPVPFDLLADDCDFTIAVNVLGTKQPDAQLAPSLFEAFFNTYQIMEESIVKEKMRHSKPDIYIEPQIKDVRVLAFNKYDSVFQQSQNSIDIFDQQLQETLR